MLPAFPKIEAVRARRNRQMLKDLAAQHAPVLREIDQHIQFEGRGTEILRHDDTVGHSPLHPVSAEVRVDRLRLVDFTEEELSKKLEQVAQQLARGVSEMFYAEMERGTAEVGNVIDAGGQPLSEELILKLIEKMEHTFEPDGSWNPPTLLVSPDVFDKLIQRVGDNGGGSSEFQRSLKQILQKKRDDFRRREADRILAG
jgi:hypothetical protein